MMSRFVLLFSVLCTAAFAAQAPAPATSTAPVYRLKRVLIADSEAHVMAMKPDPKDTRIVQVQDVRLLTRPDFQAVIAPFVGDRIDGKLLTRLGSAIAQYAKAHDRMLAQVLMPKKQNVADGSLRLMVVIGRFQDIAIRGNRYFSSKLLREQLGIKPGDEVRLSVLEDAVNWANTNPFRRLRVIVNDLPSQPGKADLLVAVQDVRPWRFSTSVDNYGTDLLGNRHYTATVQFGNLWGLGHQGSYQYVTTDNPRLYQAHVFDYRVPLPWRHFIELSASYARVQPTFGAANAFTQKGVSTTADLKYSIPLRSGDNPIEFHTGFDFKRSNNNLEYGGASVYAANADTLQWATGGSLVQHDRRGYWVLAGTVNVSPGGLDAHNHTSTYEAARQGATPRYIYGDLSVQRDLLLGRGWEYQSRLIGQLASTNLIGSEELAVGGPTSVRGFNTNVYAGDQGFIFGNDLLTPSITTSLDRIRKTLPPLQTRFTFFYDAAQVFVKHSYGPAVDPALTPLAGAGVGLRMSVSNNFSLSFDYGWQITHLPTVYRNTAHGRGNIQVVLAF